MNNVNDSSLSAAGRFGRMSYLGWNSLLLITVMIIGILCAILLPGFKPDIDQGMPLSMLLTIGIIYFAMLYLTFIFTIRRLHDRNHTGWLSLLLLVPIANICLALYLIFAKGDAHENQYGWPRPTQTWEKILGWIYILIIPLGILAGISVPAYQDYVQRAKQAQIEMQQQ
ncbi:DUF805 domain-containing protein [Acinetobacter tianfuensis]|uniref:DUF805 domain-containing protein n=1 Tax=Acinetobacter tianfuensis TaxID=2419603 RepID=A0A3A8EGD5_9GAMM|nr:DUF805 domain-containing protein [Acinetobacter tianfuensis]RKG29840.1 DUF805 domain-containing protein [Acinetobacter tianfuensis]